MGGTSSLPPGFRFHPTDDELVGYYLKRKVDGRKIELEVIPVVDLYKFDPWELPDKSFLPTRDMEWFFFCPRDRKYPNGSRTNRATTSGYWKATGKDRKITCDPSTVGLRKTLVFHRGRAPAGDRTDWVMHEYRLCEELPHGTSAFVGGFALCRVIKRSDQGQKGSEATGEPRPTKRVAHGAVNNLSSGRILEVEERNIFGRGKSDVLTLSAPPPSENGGGTESGRMVVNNCQTNHRVHDLHLLDHPAEVLPGGGCGVSSFPGLLTNSVVGPSLHDPMNLSPMLPSTGFVAESRGTADVNGSLMTSLNSLNFTESCTSEDATALSGLEGVASNPSAGEFETWNGMTSPTICRQTSGDGIWELATFLPPEESLTVW